jgi:hypothetical protein
MNTEIEETRRLLGQQSRFFLLTALLSGTFLVLPVEAQERQPRDDPESPYAWRCPFLQSKANTPKTETRDSVVIPSGTVLPVRLNSTLSSSKSRPGQEISARIMQDVPLPAGGKIPVGRKVVGHIIAVSPAANGAGTRISFRFEQVVTPHQTIPVNTNVRALAGFMRILEAQTPPIGPGERATSTAG